MRLLAIAALAAVLASPASAQAPVGAHAAFRAAVDACRQIVEANGAAAVVARVKASAGLVAAPPEPDGLRMFFKDIPRVDWWRRPAAEGRVHVGYDPAGNKCRAFLLATPRGTVIDQALGALPAGWFAQEAGKTMVRRRDDGSLIVLTVLPGDESKGIHDNTLSVMGLVWTIPPDEEEQ